MKLTVVLAHVVPEAMLLANTAVMEMPLETVLIEEVSIEFDGEMLVAVMPV